MPESQNSHVLIVLHLIGGNDALNTLVPYGNPLYYDSRPIVRIPEEQVLAVDQAVGFHPSMAKLLPFYQQGKMAIILGIGYPNRNYSHFRSTDIWETAQPENLVANGWLAKVVRELDPRSDNVLTAVSFGLGLPRALSMTGVPVASVSKLDSYGLFTATVSESERQFKVELVSKMYAASSVARQGAILLPTNVLEQSDRMLQYMGETGRAAIQGAARLQTVPATFTSDVSYPKTPIAAKLRGIAQIKRANLGTRVFYTSHGSFDTHALQLANHAERWLEVSEAIEAFFQDLHAHDAAEDVTLFLWSEFGRRVRDNGGGTDHGAGGLAFVIGEHVKGGMYGEYPSLRESALVGGNLDYSIDFRALYSSLLERWLRVDAHPIVGAPFEQLALL